MIGVLLRRENLRTDRPTGRMVYEHEDRARGNVFKPRSVRDCSQPPEAAERRGAESCLALSEAWSWQYLKFQHVAFGTVR